MTSAIWWTWPQIWGHFAPAFGQIWHVLRGKKPWTYCYLTHFLVYFAPAVGLIWHRLNCKTPATSGYIPCFLLFWYGVYRGTLATIMGLLVKMLSYVRIPCMTSVSSLESLHITDVCTDSVTNVSCHDTDVLLGTGAQYAMPRSFFQRRIRIRTLLLWLVVAFW